MSALRRGEGGGTRPRKRGAAAEGRKKAAAGERPGGRSRSSAAERATGRRRKAEEPAPSPAVARRVEAEALGGLDLLRGLVQDLLAPRLPAFAPAVDLCERDDVFEVVCELPGVSPDDVQVNVHRDRLTIEGERRPPSLTEGEVLHLAERGQGRFVRAFRLPMAVDPDSVEATYADGLLRVRVRKPRAGAPRRIEVRGRAGRPSSAPGHVVDEHHHEEAFLAADASGGVRSARPPAHGKDEGPMPLERREVPPADDLTIPHVGARQRPVGGQGAEQSGAGGPASQPGGDARRPTAMNEPPGAETPVQPKLDPEAQSGGHAREE
ncbi:MAG: Hsp20/alpha crystallin family protein [Planctomycetes bacterium]|nr:Hsp20/alpha crystallin family protein [Planctomycetota bacterium]